MSAVDYEADFHAWTQRQADALRRRAAGELVNETELDWGNLAEEIESAGRSEKHEIRSRLEILLIHLLKWRHDPDFRSNSWRASIHEARRRIELILIDSPSLRAFPAQALDGAYRLALLNKEVRGLSFASDLPAACPWAVEDVLDEDFLP